MLRHKSTMGNKAPCLPAILIAMAVCQCNTKHIAQCNMSWAIPEASGCGHRATTPSLLSQRPRRQQQRKQQKINTPTLLAILMAMAMLRYVTVRIAWWRRSSTSVEATGCCHWASIHSDNIKGTYLRQFFWCFSSSTHWKRAQSKRMAPNKNRGTTCQTDGKHSSKTVRYLVRGVNVAFNHLRDWLTLSITSGKIGFQSQLWDNEESS